MYPATRPDRQPSPWWYYGRALYVSRRDYFKIYCALMATLGIPMVFVALYFDVKFMKIAALGAGTVSPFSAVRTFALVSVPPVVFDILRRVTFLWVLAGPFRFRDFWLLIAGSTVFFGSIYIFWLEPFVWSLATWPALFWGLGLVPFQKAT